MLIGNVFQQIYSMADAMVVGRYVSGGALAAVGISGFILNFSLAVMIGLTTGSSVLISQFFGAKQMEKLIRSVSTSFLFLTGLVLFVSAGGIAASSLLLRILNAPADIFDQALLYLRILLGGMVFTMLYNMFTSYLRALGDTKMPLYILIFSTLLNIGLDLLFVVRLNFGVAGVAWATMIAQAVAASLCYLYIVKFVPVLKISSLTFDRVLFRSILRYSIPAAIQLSLTSFASLTIMRLVNSFGSVAAAGYTAAVKIDQFAIMPLASVSMAISTFVAQNMGAQLEARARAGLHSSLKIMAGMAAATSVAALVFGRQVIALFVDSDARILPGLSALERSTFPSSPVFIFCLLSFLPLTVSSAAWETRLS